MVRVEIEVGVSALSASSVFVGDDVGANDTATPRSSAVGLLVGTSMETGLGIVVGLGVSSLPPAVSAFVGDDVGADKTELSGISVEGLLVGPTVVRISGIGVGLGASHVPLLSALVSDGVGEGEKMPPRSHPAGLLLAGSTVGTSLGMITVGLDVYPPPILSSGVVVGDEVGASEKKMSPPLSLLVDGLDVGANVKFVPPPPPPPRVVSEGLLVGYPPTKPVGVGVDGAVIVAGVLVAPVLGAGEAVGGVELPPSWPPSDPVIGPGTGTPTENGGLVKDIA